MSEMNARLVKNTIVFATTCIASSFLLAGCAFDPPSAADSRLAARIDVVTAERTNYPRLKDFPEASTDLPAPEAIKNRVGQLEQIEQALDAQVAAIDWDTEGDAEVNAMALRRPIDNAPVQAPTAETPAEIEAFAQQLRDRAKAPPVVDRPLR